MTTALLVAALIVAAIFVFYIGAFFGGYAISRRVMYAIDTALNENDVPVQEQIKIIESIMKNLKS